MCLELTSYYLHVYIHAQERDPSVGAFLNSGYICASV